ncbi:hypothetical protein F4861DRAFT_525477 [Xylaria intraflava]|nr:hypothetical protein F4861DRAFT_525477 [Xylaria intraflava]
MVRSRLLVQRAVVLVGLITLAIRSVHAQAPWQIGGGIGGANNPYNPNNNNNNNNNNADGSNSSNNSGDAGTNNTTGENGSNTNTGNNNNNNNNNIYPGEGNHGGTNNNNDGLPSPPTLQPGPGLNTFDGSLSYASVTYYRDAHGILAAAAFAFVFPLGSILMRTAPTKHAWLLHGTIQAVAYAIYIAAAGLGLKLVSMARLAPSGTFLGTAGANAHPAIGIVLLVALFAQPLLGVAHHRRFKVVPTRTWVSHAHLWLGRAGITLGIINGGLGLLLARADHGPVVAYAVVAGVMWGLWVLAAVAAECGRARRQTLQGHVAPKESEALAVPRSAMPDFGSAPPPPAPAASAPGPAVSGDEAEHAAAADLPPYTPGPHYRTHMEQIQQQRERTGGDDEGGKAEFEVVPIYPTSREEMYRGQV